MIFTGLYNAYNKNQVSTGIGKRHGAGEREQMESAARHSASRAMCIADKARRVDEPSSRAVHVCVRPLSISVDMAHAPFNQPLKIGGEGILSAVWRAGRPKSTAGTHGFIAGEARSMPARRAGEASPSGSIARSAHAPRTGSNFAVFPSSSGKWPT
jgi:hypothetical protein